MMEVVGSRLAVVKMGRGNPFGVAVAKRFQATDAAVGEATAPCLVRKPFDPIEYSTHAWLGAYAAEL
jgi:hypothetical protein